MSMLDPLPENPYTTLGVPKDASVNDVKKAYRKLVLTCHPDKTGSLPASMKKEKDDQFHKVQQAHDLLTNPNERQRYDERVQLEELRSELRRDLGKDGMPPSMFKSASYSHKPRSAPKTPSKSPTNPMFDAARGPPIYETRVPKGVYDEDVYGLRRGSSRKHEERFEAPSTPRRSVSGRGDRMPEDIKKPERKEDDEEYYARKSREKASKDQQRTAQEERKKQRTKMRRNDGVSKKHAFVESESEESEVERFMGSPRTTEFRRRAEEPAVKPKASTPSRRNPSASLSDSESDVRMQSAREHMRRTGSHFDSLDKRAPAPKKKTAQPVPPPPPPPPPSKPLAESRRPSTRRSSTNTSKSKRNIDIVEPSKEYSDEHTHELPRRPKKDDSIPHSVPSSPRIIPKSARAQTFEPERVGDRPPPRRTQTMPVNANARPSRSSNLKYSKLQRSDEDDEEETSGRSSEDKTAKYTTKKYRINTSDSDSDRKPRIVAVEPESPLASPTTATATRSRARREESPRLRSHRAEVRSPPRRSNTMDNLSSHNPAPTSSRESRSSRHHHSSSGDKLLFMEVPTDVSFAPRIGRDDIRYTEQRRSSTDGVLPNHGSGSSSRHSTKDRHRGKDEYYRQAHRGDHPPSLSRGTASYTSVHV